MCELDSFGVGLLAGYLVTAAAFRFEVPWVGGLFRSVYDLFSVVPVKSYHIVVTPVSRVV